MVNPQPKTNPDGESPASSNPFDPWQYKPWWCQPWSIVLTGAIAIFIPAWLTHNPWLTVAVALPISVWWGYFLWLWPRLLQNLYTSAPDRDRR
jgi:hypothetical protein